LTVCVDEIIIVICILLCSSVDIAVTTTVIYTVDAINFFSAELKVD